MVNSNAEDEDNEEGRAPRRKKKKKQQQGRLLPWILAGGGVALVAVGAIILVVVFNQGGAGPSTQEGPGPFAGDQGRPEQKKAPANPDLLVDISGPWLEPMAKGNSNSPDWVTFRIVVVGDSFQISKRGVADTEKAVRDRLLALTGAKGGHTGASDDAPDGRARLMAVRMGPVREDLQTLAQKIDFGTVRSVNDRVVTLVVRKEAVSAAKPMP
jgi:hypothetical protein